MIVGTGIDVVDIPRFAETLERTPGLRTRLFTEAERGLPMRSLAARFAAKEALAKALRIERALGWHDAEVVVDAYGRPSFAVTGSVAARAAELGVTSIHLSLSHDGGVAVAYVVCEGDQPGLRGGTP